MSFFVPLVIECDLTDRDSLHDVFGSIVDGTAESGLDNIEEIAATIFVG